MAVPRRTLALGALGLALAAGGGGAALAATRGSSSATTGSTGTTPTATTHHCPHGGSDASFSGGTGL